MTPLLRSAIDLNRLPHANLLAGGSIEDARTLAAAYNCLSHERRPCGICLPCIKLNENNHPDVLIFDCVQAKIDQIRAITSETQVLPNESRRKVLILQNADELSPICQNALLKTLEEPPGSAAFILTANSPSSLLPTVRSRLTAWNMVPEPEPETGGELSGEILKAYDSTDELKLLLACLSCDKLTRDEMGALIDAVRRGLLERRGLNAAERLGDLRLTLERNAGIGHVCGAMSVILSSDFK